jgi:hypothetical protein
MPTYGLNEFCVVKNKYFIETDIGRHQNYINNLQCIVLSLERKLGKIVNFESGNFLKS